jgi:hypothetical protein
MTLSRSRIQESIIKRVDLDLVVLGKMPLTKKAHEKSLMSIEQSLMVVPNCLAGQGKDGTAANLGQAWLL